MPASMKLSLYSRINNSSSENLFEQGSEKDQSITSSKKQTWAAILPWLGHIALLCLWLALFASLRSTKVECAKELSTFCEYSATWPTLTPKYAEAPASEAIEYEKILFNGSLYYPSEYRGVPTPGVDAAWDRIATVAPIPVTSDTLVKIGKTIRPSLVRFPDELGGEYAAALEVTHQLHCVDLLRKFTYPDYYKPSEADPDLYRAHIDHCIEMLRQNIMCRGDVGIITFDWVEGHANPYPDFNTWHQCRNFERIKAWNDEHALPILPTWRRPADAVPLTEAP